MPKIIRLMLAIVSLVGIVLLTACEGDSGGSSSTTTEATPSAATGTCLPEVDQAGCPTPEEKLGSAAYVFQSAVVEGSAINAYDDLSSRCKQLYTSDAFSTWVQSLHSNDGTGIYDNAVLKDATATSFDGDYEGATGKVTYTYMGSSYEETDVPWVLEEVNGKLFWHSDDCA